MSLAMFTVRVCTLNTFVFIWLACVTVLEVSQKERFSTGFNMLFLKENKLGHITIFD
jgi:hypothetical protein